MADILAYPQNQLQAPVTIDVLPDDVLLAIFDLYVLKIQDNFLQMVFSTADEIESWQLLVHVCRRWRYLVFGSQRRLNLQLYCNLEISARRTLDVWPSLPLLISGGVDPTAENAIAQLKHTEGIRQIDLNFDTISNSPIGIENLWTAMQVPFPELTILRLSYTAWSDPPVLPDSFLAGSAPRLRYLELNCIPFPGLPNLHLSTTHLVHLSLHNIPHSGYISPEAMTTCLSTLTSLERLQLEFESPQSSPGRENQRLPPPKSSVLPALTSFWFKGTNEYLEKLVARINTPQLNQLSTIFFNDLDFDMPELIQFVSHSPTLKSPNEAHIFFDSQTASVRLQPQASYDIYFEVKIICSEPGWQLSSLAQICTTSLPLLSTMENLFIYGPVVARLDWKDGIENIEWLELLLPFTAVKYLYICKKFAPRVAPALQEMTEGGTTELLSALQDLHLEGFKPSESVEEGIERFISARQLTDHPVAVSVWDR